jgi:hypothetical protein
MSRGLERAYPPRGLRREDAARYVGVGVTKFDEWIREGLMPKGKLVDGCRLWDRHQLDSAFENLPDAEAAPALAPQSPTDAWSGVQ